MSLEINYFYLSILYMSKLTDDQIYRALLLFLMSDSMTAVNAITDAYPSFIEDMQNNRVLKELHEYDPTMTNEELIACAYAVILWLRLSLTYTKDTLSNVVIPSRSVSSKPSKVFSSSKIPLVSPSDVTVVSSSVENTP